MKRTGLSRGFTIVELLIVIVVIAILAAITIAAYNGVQDRSRSSTLQSDLANAKKKLLLYQADQGQYPSSVATLTNAGIEASKSVYDTVGNNFYYCLNTVTKEYAMGARTISNKAAYIIGSTTGLTQVAGVGADQVCQTVGLTGYADANAYISNGHASGIGWASWVN